MEWKETDCLMCVSGKAQVEGFCDHDDEPSDFIKDNKSWWTAFQD